MSSEINPLNSNKIPMMSHNISIPIAQRKKSVQNTSFHIFQSLQAKRRAGYSTTGQLDHFGSMLELFNLKKLKLADVGGFSKGLVFDQEVNYECEMSNIQTLNQMTLEKVKDMSLNIQMLKSAISAHEMK